MPPNSIPPLTAASGLSGRSELRKILSDGPSQPIFVCGRWSVGATPGKYFVVWDNDGVLTELDAFIIPGGIPGTFAAALKLPAGEYILGDSGTPGEIGVYSGISLKGGSAGEWSIGNLDIGLTESMSQMAAPHGVLAL